jgi:hydroxymethylpyrimidine/phosphomethylpyrimidine kinase
MVAASGARLLEADALDALRVRLIPLATILTPNIPEAELLLGHAIDGDAAANAAVAELLALGARAMLLKGGHLQGSAAMVDRYSDGEKSAEFTHDRLDVEGHGTGCTLASAIAANLCLGKTLPGACEAATDYVHGALRHSARPGLGHVAVLDHFWRTRS